MMTKQLIFFLILLPAATHAKGTYQTPADFVAEAFSQQPPKPSVIWLRGDIKKKISEILQHKVKFLRLRYWQKNNRSVWVINEIGKEKDITTGVVVNNGTLEKVKTLIFRESRGWEISQDFFTQQFIGATLSHDHQLTPAIDSITGATLSVRAVDKISRIALFLHQTINNRNTK